MACLNNLKLEIRTLESVFTKTHERFQVVSASVDELTCRFIGKYGKQSDIHANITVSIILILTSKMLLSYWHLHLYSVVLQKCQFF